MVGTFEALIKSAFFGVLVVQCLWDINDDRDFDPERREFYSHAC
jgi:hypothetical protein